MLPIRLPRFDALVSLGCLLLLAYFAWHAWQGPRGYGYSQALALKLESLQAESADLAKQKAVLEARVKLMRPESVDRDMLEELARRQLFMVRSNELIIRASR